jgi:hypothetical protein
MVILNGSFLNKKIKNEQQWRREDRERPFTDQNIVNSKIIGLFYSNINRSSYFISSVSVTNHWMKLKQTLKEN